jgi:hypothetical protein
MPPYNWAVDPVQLVQSFESKHNNPVAGALFAWAVWTVDCLYYLDDLDEAFDRSRAPIAQHRPDVVDVAHARWATGTSITSLDLCAAGLGHAFCGNTGTHEFDIGDINAARKAQLPPEAQQWFDRVIADPQYNIVKSARDWLTHSRVSRHSAIGGASLPERLKLQFGPSRLPVRDLVLVARDLATRHVADFTQILSRI